ncbi:MAG: YebC/PmpR family DNA-binding transcriptional regulator [Lachnospiraceae bacterium]
MIIVDLLTDNKNRTAANVRKHVYQGRRKRGENRKMYVTMFDKKGQIIIDKEECEMDADEPLSCWLWMQALRISLRKRTATKYTQHQKIQCSS